tara:strand:- start:30 stop:167 length:138 start_codon:yes stop_codon:yes gene_type:complete
MVVKVVDTLKQHRLNCLKMAERRAKNPEFKKLWSDMHEKLLKSKS